jgi:ribosomal protein S18 acetylase RimI-like enzyme
MDGSRLDNISDIFAYSIIHVPHDEAGIRKYLDDYKAFRLLSLQIAPEAFASTYAREVAFDDSVWYERLSNPIANSFLAIGETGKILSMSTMIGPLSYGTLEIPPLGNPWTGQDGWEAMAPLHFRLNAIFTLPEARRRGISKALIKRSIKHTTDEARAKNKDIIFSVIVDTDNLKAKALYESVGFGEAARLEPENIFGLPVSILEYEPSAKVGQA